MTRDLSLWLTALSPEALRVVKSSSLVQVPGTKRMFFNLRKAL